MKRAAALILSLGLLSGCASHKAQITPQAQKDTARAEATFTHCAPDPFVLLKKPARQRFVTCAVPRGHRREFEQCLTSGILTGGLPTYRRIKAVSLTCLGKVA